MSNNAADKRPHYLPGPGFGQKKIPLTRQPQRSWFRVHRTANSPVQFGKFSHHRFSHSDCPYSLLYVGASVSVCLWEYFGDEVFGGQRVISAGKWNGCSLSEILVPALNVCAVSHELTRDAMGVDKSGLLATDLGIPQAWGLAVQSHPAGFEAIKYSSRFIDLPCLAVFDRNGINDKLQINTLGPLSDLDAAVDWLEERNAALV